MGASDINHPTQVAGLLPQPRSMDLDDTLMETLTKHVFDMDVPEVRCIISSILAPPDALSAAVLSSFACQID